MSGPIQLLGRRGRSVRGSTGCSGAPDWAPAGCTTDWAAQALRHQGSTTDRRSVCRRGRQERHDRTPGWVGWLTTTLPTPP